MSDKWYISGPLGIGALEPAGKLDVQGDIRAGNSDLYFTKTDHEHTGIGNTTGYAAIENASNFDALMILGRAGTDKGRKVRLWDYLEVNGPLAVQGDIRAGNSDLYFTKTDHEHSGIGNTTGYAAIENASNFDALMILGRTGTDQKRKVRLWDFLEVNGPLNVTADLIVGAGGNAVMKTRHIEGKNGQNDDADMLYLNWHSGKDVQVGESSRRSNLAVWGNVGIGTTTPTSARLQFDNGGGDKVVVYDAGPADRYGLGLNSGNLNAFVPAGGRFSVRQNGHDGTEVMAVTGAGDVTLKGNLFWSGDASDSFYIILGTVQICWGTIEFSIPKLNNPETVDFQRSFGTAPLVLISLNDPGAHPTVDREQSLTCGVGARDVTESGFGVICKTSKAETNRRILCTWIAIGKT